MASGELIYSGNWSRGYKNGMVFIKKLNHYEPLAMAREIAANRAAANAGVNTPLCSHFSDKDQILSLYFPFIKINKIESFSKDIVGKIKEQILLMKNVTWNQNDRYWETHLLPDFRDALGYVKHTFLEIETILASLSSEVFIHGDFSKDNIGIGENGLTIFDFQHGCIGPKDWDFSYLAGSLYPSQCENFRLTDSQKLMALCVATIKYGRAIRKQSPEICSTYKKMIAWQNETCLILYS